MNLIEQLARDEGVRLRPYTDTVGKTTIGVGRNLDDVGISREEAMALLANDIKNASDRVEQEFPWASQLDEARHGALVNMCFNMGVGRLLGFHKFLAALEAGDFKTASTEMLQSQWAQQVGARAQRLAQQIETGIWQ
jgi:lysozyme